LSLLQNIHEVDGVIFLTLDNLGGKEVNPCLLTTRDLIFPIQSDPALLESADQIADETLEFG
jgi:hypothetical protein